MFTRLRRFTYLHAEDHPLTPFHGCIGLFSPPLPPPVQPSPVQENSSVLVTTVGKEVRKKERFCLDLPSHLHHPRNVVASPPPRIEGPSRPPTTTTLPISLCMSLGGEGEREWKERAFLQDTPARLEARRKGSKEGAKARGGESDEDTRGGKREE